MKYMYELGKQVPLVPVVTKADTMTIREASTYRTEVANKLSNPMVPGGWLGGQQAWEEATLLLVGWYTWKWPLDSWLTCTAITRMRDLHQV